jgi:hypothetical protein
MNKNVKDFRIDSKAYLSSSKQFRCSGLGPEGTRPEVWALLLGSDFNFLQEYRASFPRFPDFFREAKKAWLLYESSHFPPFLVTFNFMEFQSTEKKLQEQYEELLYPFYPDTSTVSIWPHLLSHFNFHKHSMKQAKPKCDLVKLSVGDFSNLAHSPAQLNKDLG